jgi:protein ImuB
MPLADARALVPGLTAADAAPEADAEILAELADWCSRYGPWVAADGNDAIRLDITGCAHLFGGEMEMLRDMGHRLRAFGFTVQGAVADTPAAAWGWARHRPKKRTPILEPGETEPLLSLPIVALRLDPDSIDTLRVLGLSCVGEVAALPRGPLTQRLGDGVLHRLDRLFGRTAEPISPRPIAEPWISRMIFAEPIGRREDIDAATERLVAHLCHQMTDKGRGARRLVLTFYRVDGGVQHIAIGTSSPSHAPNHIVRLFAERLDTVEPGFGIEAIVLEATEAEPLSPLQSAFSAAGEIDAVALARLIDRLRNRLGPNRVVQLVPVESHVPERAEIQTFAHAPSPAAAKGGCLRNAKATSGRGGRGRGSLRSNGRVRGLFASSSLKSARPLTLLPIPEPIEAIAPVPDDPPLSFLWHKVRYRIAFADGPERIGPEWWLPMKARPRDYYRVEDVGGRRFWLYREGLYGAAEPPRWFLHGFFP